MDTLPGKGIFPENLNKGYELQSGQRVRSILLSVNPYIEIYMSGYVKDHIFICPHCDLKWRTTEITPKLHCKQCKRDFLNPWAAPAPRK